MKKNSSSRSLSGFSLVELSIVITIIGLIIGAVLGGKALLEQSQVSKMIAQVEEIKTSHLRFKDKYGQSPGDFNAAARFWPAKCIDDGTNTCNGNGDGNISFDDRESLRAWQHLTLSGLYPSTFTGIWDGGLKLNTNIPAAVIPQTGIDVNFHEVSGAFAPVFGRNGNSIQLGSETTFPTWGGATFTPEEAYQIDKKFDDALASTGYFLTSTTGAVSVPNCTSNRETSATGDYVLSNNARTCRIWIFGLN
ncbi:MAG: prepilin-type N-terminal cleavage/methylation domain-containing protein [Alphaproteobacteria bacterium]|nr:prepilin-type N-terminal cleavage/methylation domain-containing protein [Alphaproteobacteria bacterium]